MAPTIIRISRHLPHARDAAYQWLTDIQDDDVQRTAAVLVSRRVTLREKDRLVYEGGTQVLGVTTRAVTEVSLQPPEAWEARVLEGPRTGSSTSYRLIPQRNGCRLEVEYRFVFTDAKRAFATRLLRPLVKRSLGQMWDGFAQDMARELPRTDG